jgi:hypothetical protein
MDMGSTLKPTICVYKGRNKKGKDKYKVVVLIANYKSSYDEIN